MTLRYPRPFTLATAHPRLQPAQVKARSPLQCHVVLGIVTNIHVKRTRPNAIERLG